MFAIDFGNIVIFWGLGRKYCKKHAPKYILYVLLCHGLVTDLLSSDVLPPK
jgi:hypothetical protein